MAYIYQIVNDINQKKYVGKTEVSIEKRFYQHCKDALKPKNEKRPLYAAMRKYGQEHFHIELIEETDHPEEREKFWIEELSSFKNGYNATRGGDGSRYIDYGLIFSLYKENKTYKEIQSLVNCDPQTIQKALDSYGVSKEERAQQNSAHLFKAVAKLDKDTFEIIETYPSVREAERANGNTNHIADVCKGKRETCKGYKWKYL